MLVRVREGLSYGDLHHLGVPESIAVYLIDTGDGVGVVDPGPASCREALEASLAAFGASVRDLRHVFLTHIHLDHAGITGTLARENPRLRVYVHERGAPHLVDPTRLLDSATRIYGSEMDRLWGTFQPVPADQLEVLSGHERLTIGSRRWRVGATPGHAVHHVAYLDEHDGVAFTGDVAGEATQHNTPALPVAPPPDIDLPTWRQSLDLLNAWAPEQLLLTHFGPVNHPRRHVEEMWTRLTEWSERVRDSLERSGSDDARAESFADEELDRLTSGLAPESAAHVNRDAILSSWYGLARYWRKQALRPSSPASPDSPASPT
jgi:glyoxylase-like metal-dependent hydrolase (beta-lactamase superfamily II)